MNNKILTFIGIITGILYIILDNTIEKFLFDIILKPIPIWCIALYCFNQNKYLLSIGLIFGSIGDILLTNSEEIFFILGLGSFLIGHIFYIIYFIKNYQYNLKGLILSIFIIIASIGLSFMLIPALSKNFLLPVLIYIITITIMTISTTFYKNFNFIVITGAILFLISDTIIAWNKFIHPIPHSHLYIMILYYLGQWGIGYGGSK
jgi:uncharacterized membrane protein YhhN